MDNLEPGAYMILPVGAEDRDFSIGLLPTVADASVPVVALATQRVWTVDILAGNPGGYTLSLDGLYAHEDGESGVIADMLPPGQPWRIRQVGDGSVTIERALPEQVPRAWILPELSSGTQVLMSRIANEPDRNQRWRFVAGKS
ncbi:hypothetical protein NDR87_36380 [Nocardia sp. CDC159]|uniref:Uncharacterized protein n=1 Tax=Nocardia pulmonis TaxID=2951408 RepID=A0A9X2EIW3_9NOCA|nr:MULTISPECIES: hypothetical protein [Nocardia]MCM6778966.1 hypothetical protein [Nocardia pulmonis]MCM6791855.1 hypothetical protein [Nocardia sp. CDC159]